MVEIPERSHGEQYGPQLLASNQNGQKNTSKWPAIFVYPWTAACVSYYGQTNKLCRKHGPNPKQ